MLEKWLTTVFIRGRPRVCASEENYFALRKVELYLACRNNHRTVTAPIEIRVRLSPVECSNGVGHGDVHEWIRVEPEQKYWSGEGSF